ncbi:MAG: hypothetical protein P0116_08050 [Candidatus Nitrosocosmicus sp.]|nr:hypothetical protein [Candidatus Nitrosocosmicus sp.]
MERAIRALSVLLISTVLFLSATAATPPPFVPQLVLADSDTSLSGGIDSSPSLDLYKAMQYDRGSGDFMFQPLTVTAAAAEPMLVPISVLPPPIQGGQIPPPPPPEDNTDTDKDGVVDSITVTLSPILVKTIMIAMDKVMNAKIQILMGYQIQKIIVLSIRMQIKETQMAISKEMHVILTL